MQRSFLMVKNSFLSKGEKITVTHKLGGNFTVMTLMVCIVLLPKMLMRLVSMAKKPKEKVHDANTEPATKRRSE